MNKIAPSSDGPGKDFGVIDSIEESADVDTHNESSHSSIIPGQPDMFPETILDPLIPGLD